MDSGAAVRWRISSPASIAWREWGDDVVVYVGCRADTHLFTATAGAVLQSLLDSNSPLTLEAAFDRAFGGPQATATQDISPREKESLAAMLREFQLLGIATRVS